MRKLIAPLLLLVFFTTAAFAQGGPAKRGASRGDQFLKELNLTAEQQKEIQTIRQETRQELQALRSSQNRAEAKAIRQRSKDAIRAVLTPEQRTELDAKVDAHRADKKENRQALREELKAYREQEVEPVLRAARSQFDQYVSAADRQEIERLRGVFADRPEKGHKRGKGTTTGKPGAADKQAAAQAWRDDHAADIASLNTLLKRYATELKRAEEALSTRRATWEKEQAAIRAKYHPEGARQFTKKRSGERKMKGKKEGGAARRFLLMKA